jgi:photosystem II stability/assembly factor-like uncharacterized protein
MKTTLRLLLLLLILQSPGFVHAQSWTLISPVKTQSSIRSVFMTSASTGYEIDDLDDRVLQTRNGGQTWTRQGTAFSLTPTSLWMFNDTVGLIATSTGTFYKTTDGFLTRTSISTSTGSSKSMYFIDNNINIKKTTNGGSSWTLITTGNTNTLFGLHFVDANTGFACGGSGTVIKTTDGGTSWPPLSTGFTFNLNDVLFTTTSAGVAVGSNGYITRTTDGGTTWTAITSPTTQSLTKLYYANNILFAVGANGVLLKSVNGGLNWTSTALGNKDHYTLHINSLGVGLIGSDATIFKTTDFGATWTICQAGLPHSYLNKISFANDQVGIAVGWQTTNGIQNALVRTTDGGKTWTGRTQSVATLGVHLRADGNGVIGGSNGYNERTTDYGQTFNFGSAPAVAVRATWSQNATTYILAGGFVNGGIYRTINSGSTWSYTSGGNIFDIYFPSDQVGYAGGEGGVLKKTTNGGVSWSSINSGTTSDINSIFFINDLVGYIAGINSTFKTTDGGTSWAIVNPLSNVYAIHFYTIDSGYAVTGGGSLLKTIDAGNSWTLVAPGNITDMSVRDAAFLNGKVIAVGLQGDIFVTNLTCSNAALTPQIIQNGNTLYSSFASGNQWYHGSGAIAGSTGSIYTPTAPGTYYVINTTSQGCQSSSSNAINVVATAVSYVAIENSLKIYPNPTHATITIEIPAPLRSKAVLVRAATGQLVYAKQASNRATMQLDFSSFPAGTYYLSVGEKISKIIVRK